MYGEATAVAPVASAGLRSRTSYQPGKLSPQSKRLFGGSYGGQCEAGDHSEQLCEVLMDVFRPDRVFFQDQIFFMIATQIVSTIYSSSNLH